MNYGSVCSGLEAATAAWHPLGWKAAWFSEIEKFPSAVLAHHYPETPNLGDMTRLHDHPKRSAIRLLVGGTPCQSFSVAGLRKGMDDARGNLALVFIQLLRRTGAEWVLWENVPGVLSSSGGKDLASFFGGLVGREVEIPEEGWGVAGILEPSGPDDYGIAWRVLDAQYFGVPQRRRRLFVVGYIGDWRPAAAVLLELHSVSGNPPPSRCKREGTPRGIEIGPSGGKSTDLAPTLDARCKDGPRRNQLGIAVTHAVTGHGQYANVPLTVRASGGDCGGGSEALVSTFSPPDVAGTLGSNHGNIKAEQAWTGQLVVDPTKPQAFSAEESRADNFPPEDCAPPMKVKQHLAICFDTTQITHPANHSNPQPGDPCHPLASGGHPPAIIFKAAHFTRGKDGAPSDIAPPLSADADKGDQDSLVLQEQPFKYVVVLEERGSGERHEVRGTWQGEWGTLISHWEQGNNSCDCNRILEICGDGALVADEELPCSSWEDEQLMLVEIRMEGHPTIAFGSKDSGADASEEVSPTLRSGAHDGSHANAGVPPAVVYSIMPQNSGKDYKAREVDVAQPIMAAGPGGGNQGGDLVLEPLIFDPLNNKADDVATSLGTNCGGSTGRSIAFTQNQAGDILSGDVAPAMGTNQNATGRNTPKAMIGSAVRRLTPRECERLQGFPDDYTLIKYGTKVAADGPRYKALGNSMAVPCMAWLGQRIEMVDALIKGLKK